MAPKISLPENVFENLIKHLTDIEDGRIKMFEEYFPEPSEDRNEFKELLNNYIISLDRVIRNTSVSENADNCFPFVIIGSEVEVLDFETQETYMFRIVLPFQESMSNDDVSCLSPVGKSLLLKKVNDKAEVKAPAGKFYYQIRSIKFPCNCNKAL